mgnify:CR=1 FL=1
MKYNQVAFTKVAFALIALVFAIPMSGCIPSGGGGEKAAPGSAPAGTPATGGGGIVPSGLTAQAAFERTLRGEIQSRTCKSCHNSGTISISPLIADADPIAAWTALSAGAKVNLASPSASPLVAKMQSQHNCGTGTDCTTAASAFTNAINNMSVLMQPAPTSPSPGPAPGPGPTTIPGLTSMAAFQQSLWPVLRAAPANCVGCHGDTGPRAAYASSTLSTAHDTTLGGGLVNLTDPSLAGQSAIVLKIAAGHQGNPAALAGTMQSAIVQWRALMQPTVIAPPPPGDPLGTREVSAQISMPADPNTRVYIEAEAATLTQFTAQANALASGAMGFSSPVNNNVTIADANVSPQRAVFNFVAPVAGNYRIWGRSLALTNNDNEFYTRTDLQPFGTWTLPVSDVLTWNIVRNQTVNLTAGNHTFEVRMREDGAFLDKILITNDMNFTPFAQGSRTLEFNVGQLAGLANVLFRVDVAEFDQSSYIFTNPRLVVPAGSSVVVKSVMLHINGVYKAGDATFTVIDDEADSVNGNLDNAGMLTGYALIVLKGANPAMDKFSVSFGMIQVR